MSYIINKSKSRILKVSILSAILLLALLLSACVSKPESLEELISSNEEIEAQVQEAAQDAGMTVEITGNVVTYSYDLSSIEGATEEALKDEEMIKTLQSALDSQKSVFTEMCKKLEEESEISGISATVNYTYGDEVLATQTFTSAG